mgnify:CR=1 FL=1
MWDNQQIVPKEWVQESFEPNKLGLIMNGMEWYYGYQWWVDAAGFYMALGYAGQFIYVVPEKDLVVVFTSDLRPEDQYTPLLLLAFYVIPSVGS